MRWTLTILTAATFAVFGLIAWAETPKAPTPCTKTGTPQRDIMTGTPRRDVLCSIQGDDYLHGAGGRDLLKGGAGKDVLVGGGGKDVLRGDGGDDRLFAVDDRGGERILGGAGQDQCFIDRGDHVSGCERTFRGLSLEVVRGLSRTALQVMQIAEALPTSPPVVITVPSPIVVVTTVTVTRTASFPPCTPPPNHTPAPC